jgi:hypothetical protein
MSFYFNWNAGIHFSRFFNGKHSIESFPSREHIEQKKKNQRTIGFAISVDCQFGNAANMFSNFLTIIANLDFC